MLGAALHEKEQPPAGAPPTKAEREEAQAALAQLEASHRDSTVVDPADALAVIDALPDLGKSLIAADPEVRRAVFDAFRLRVEIDRNSGRATGIRTPVPD